MATLKDALLKAGLKSTNPSSRDRHRRGGGHGDGGGDSNRGNEKERAAQQGSSGQNTPRVILRPKVQTKIQTKIQTEVQTKIKVQEVQEVQEVRAAQIGKEHVKEQVKVQAVTISVPTGRDQASEQRSQLHQRHSFCDSCRKTLPDVEYYEHDIKNICGKWLCCLCADKLKIPDSFRQTNQSDFSKKRIFRREYGATKRFFR
ncbi:MAG: hypothetical protein HQK53_06415 [Oligoflexia bacterium]|nr:hypothetical protein [Oligoflexia bacterium]